MTLMSLSPFRIQKSTRKGKLRERELDHQTHLNLNIYTHVRKRVAALSVSRYGKIMQITSNKIFPSANSHHYTRRTPEENRERGEDTDFLVFVRLVGWCAIAMMMQYHRLHFSHIRSQLS